MKIIRMMKQVAGIQHLRRFSTFSSRRPEEIFLSLISLSNRRLVAVFINQRLNLHKGYTLISSDSRMDSSVRPITCWPFYAVFSSASSSIILFKILRIALSSPVALFRAPHSLPSPFVAVVLAGPKCCKDLFTHTLHAIDSTHDVYNFPCTYGFDSIFHLQLRLLAAISASGQRRATQNNNIQLNPFEPGTEEVGLCPRGPFRITNNLFILSFSPLLLPDESHCDNPCGGRLDVVAALPGGRWSTIDGPGGRCCCSRPLDCRRDLAGGRP